MHERPLRILAALFMAQYLLGLPGYCLRWVIGQKRLGQPSGLGWLQLGPWLAALLAPVAYLSSDRWYREDVPAMTNRFGQFSL